MTPTREFEIESSAERVRAILFVYDSSPLDLRTLIARIGDVDTNPRAQIKLMPKEQMKYDEAYTDCTSKIITIPSTLPDQLGPEFPYNRFSLAHELGHLALGHKGTRSRAVAGRDFRKDANVPGVWQEETEASLWASLFLMPTSIVIKCTTAWELASSCGVSREAARIRMDNHQRRLRRASGEKRPIPEDTQKLLTEMFSKAGVKPKAFEIPKSEKIKTIEAAGSAEIQGYQPMACAECGRYELLRMGGCLTCQNCGDSNCN